MVGNLKQKSKYTSTQYTFAQLKSRVKVPKFQRRLVWSKQQKKEFISTLSKGFPFGSILIYKYSDDEKISLIDGLQRFSTIMDYEENPQEYIEISEEIDSIINLIETCCKDKLNTATKSALKKNVNEIVKELITEANPDPKLLFEKLSENEEVNKHLNVKSLGQTDILNLVTIQHGISNKKLNYLQIDQILIPTVEFLGDIGELAEVFENLNKGGKKLSKYQVFAAQWYDKTIILNDLEHNKSVLEEIIKRYEQLNNKREIQIEDFSPENLRKSKEINLSELCYALGKLIISKSAVFFKGKNEDSLEDLSNELGYTTMGIVLGIDNKKLYDIENKIELLQDAKVLNKLIDKVLMVFTDIDDHFEKLLKVPGTKEKYENKKITNFKFLSYFADLWTRYFSITGSGQIIDKSRSIDISYSKTIDNFIYHYIFDAVYGNWGNAGDSRLNQYYLERTRSYINKPSEKDFKDVLSIWWQERLSNASIQFDDNSKMLLTVYYNLNHGENGLKSGRKYDIEHIIARSKVKDIYKSLKLPMGTIGNAIFLDANLNRTKKDLNLYNLTSTGQDIDKAYIDFANYPAEDAINNLEILISSNSTETKKEVFEFVEKRGKKLLRKLLSELYKS